MRPEDERYFERIESRLDEAFDRAERAKAQGRDPEPGVEIPVAKDMADRVENILGIDGVAERVRELEGQMSREEAALELVTDFVEGTVGDYEGRAGKVEGAVRTAVALLTEGVVAAPIEGIDRVEILENDDGTEFVNVYYAGPIRSAGGTAQALSVLVADYARSLLDIDEYKARSAEIERYAEEVGLYDKETGLQYSPKDKETKFIAEHMPIMLDGEATGDEEVSGFRDLERVDTNSPRGGMCLVLAEGIALKAPKIQRYTRGLDEVDWPWLQDLIDGTIGKDGGAGADAKDGGGDEEADDSAESDGDGDGDEAEEGPSGDGDAPDSEDDRPAGPPRLDPSEKYLRDLIAGRPVFGHPSAAGGFRLRYGRARNHGFATAGVHPATMHLVDDFLATGTQIKTERPGKAAGVIPVDSIEGPTVRLANGDVRQIDDPAEALEIRNGVEKIIDLGEYLVNYGEFVENNHPLAPASYVYEWWVQEFDDAGAPVQALADDPGVDLEHPTPAEAVAWATDYDCPLHPDYTYLWHDVSVDDFAALADAVDAGRVVAAEADGGVVDRAPGDGSEADRAGAEGEQRGDVDADALVLPFSERVASALEHLLVEHTRREETVAVPEWRLLVRSLGFDVEGGTLDRDWTPEDLSARAREWDDGESALEAVNEVAPFEVRERAPTRIGNRMGRPEKSESRDLSPAVHTLFPIGDAGGSQRDVGEAARFRDDQGRRGVVDVRVGDRLCPECDAHTFRTRCPECDAHTEPHYECEECGRVVEPDESGRVYCDGCEREVTSAEWFSVDVGEEYRDALEQVGERESAYDILKGVQGLTSADKTPEPMAKGVLRAKNGVTSFKDGTVRYDMTDLPVTAVRPSELDVTAEDFRELGYETDIDGEPLEFDDQLVELKVQDIVLSDGAAEHMLKTADFVDDLLEDFYDLPPFYEVDEREDLVGELVFGMAPHTSAAVVGRVVGFTSAAVGYAHPYFHAAKRRNCDGDEDCVMLLMDGLLNFSKSYLPDKRGGQMDAPLVMSSRIDPSEIDDEAHNMDIVRQYPLEFYEATREMADPGAVEDAIKLGEDTLGTDDEYRGFDHTHDTSDIALGPDLSAYKTLGSMMDKMDAQLELSRKLRAVDETDVAKRVIEYHFLPDLIGNLRAFSRQETRCLDCGEKYRRMPLTGECRECGGRVNLTVHRGSVNKYMDTAIHVAEEFGCREYTKQRLEVLERSLESVFENDKNKQSGIADFM
ncbi:DNA polymerase II large subunit [Halobellus sp. EA9]|uniref:DNA polymerase II large subunit n=1 Tax=Halobellus sp. EA9 TaxID=3421647 RepID=UPI003EBF4F5B